MSNIVKQFTNNDKLNQLILIGLLVISGILALLYWQKDTLSIYDASGHLAAVESMRNFWPAFSGWNAKELLGYPQGVFYPPLFHWLAAGLSFLIGATAAVKLLITLAFLALPLSIYLFVRRFIIQPTWKGLTALALFSLILFSPDFLGSNVRSLFHIGLLPNFFALPIVFLFLASVPKINLRNFPLPGLLLALLILAHLVAGAIGALYLASVFLAKILFKEKSSLLPIILVLVVATALTAFFWLPSVVYHQYTSVATHGIISSYLWLNAAVLAGSLVLLVYSFRAKKENIFVLTAAGGVVAVLAIADAILFRRFGTSFILETLNIYRFQAFAYLFFSTGVFIFLSEQKLLAKYENLTKGGAVFILAAVALSLFVKNPADYPQAKVSLEPGKKTSGRFLESFRRTETFPAVYQLQTQLEKGDPQSAWAFGVFPESSGNAPFIQSLIKSLRPTAYPEGEGMALETKFVDQQRIPTLLNLFGINYLISLDEQKENVIGTWSNGEETKYYNLEKISENGPFEVFKLPLIPAEKDWDNKVESWWLEKGTVESLPYFAKEGQGTPVCTEDLENTQVKVLAVNKQQTRFELEIASDKDVPVLAKISYFPYWKASANGKELPIYRTAPNLVLLYTYGKVVLEYQEPAWLEGLYLISAATFLLVTFLLTKAKIQR